MCDCFRVLQNAQFRYGCVYMGRMTEGRSQVVDSRVIRETMLDVLPLQVANRRSALDTGAECPSEQCVRSILFMYNDGIARRLVLQAAIGRASVFQERPADQAALDSLKRL